MKRLTEGERLIIEKLDEILRAIRAYAPPEIRRCVEGVEKDGQTLICKSV